MQLTLRFQIINRHLGPGDGLPRPQGHWTFLKEEGLLDPSVDGVKTQSAFLFSTEENKRTDRNQAQTIDLFIFINDVYKPAHCASWSVSNPSTGLH